MYKIGRRHCKPIIKCQNNDYDFNDNEKFMACTPLVNFNYWSLWMLLKLVYSNIEIKNRWTNTASYTTSSRYGVV